MEGLDGDSASPSPSAIEGISQDFRTKYEKFKNCYIELVFPLSLCGANISEIVFYWMRHF